MSDAVNPNQMLSVRVKKLWKGRYASVRDYHIQQAIQKGGLLIKHEDEVMVVSPDELKCLKPDPQVMQSKFKGKYKLVDVPWKPATVDPNQGVLNV
tara:strand:- start:202 stop:489 length:288 start_codon:yes stop_codon:yes gene_type:complete